MQPRSNIFSTRIVDTVLLRRIIFCQSDSTRLADFNLFDTWPNRLKSGSSRKLSTFRRTSIGKSSSWIVDNFGYFMVLSIWLGFLTAFVITLKTWKSYVGIVYKQMITSVFGNNLAVSRLCQLLPATCLEHANFKKFIFATYLGIVSYYTSTSTRELRRKVKKDVREGNCNR